MCPPPRNASVLEKLRSDFQNSYYRLTCAYIAIMVTLIFVAVVLGWGRP